MLDKKIFETLRADFKGMSYWFVKEELKKYLNVKAKDCDEYVTDCADMVKILISGALELLSASIGVIKNSSFTKEQKEFLSSKLGLYTSEEVKKEFIEILNKHNIKPLDSIIEGFANRTLLDFLDDLEYVKNNEKHLRMKVPVEFPLQLQYEAIAFFPPTSEKIIHFQIIKNGKVIEYFAEEDHFPRYKWIERTKDTYSQIGSFIVKNPLGKPINNI